MVREVRDGERGREGEREGERAMVRENIDGGTEGESKRPREVRERW